MNQQLTLCEVVVWGKGKLLWKLFSKCSRTCLYTCMYARMLTFSMKRAFSQSTKLQRLT